MRNTAGGEETVAPESSFMSSRNGWLTLQVLVSCAVVSLLTYLGGWLRVQRYPRKLPGSDELEAEWNSLWNWKWGGQDYQGEAASSAAAPAAAAASVPKQQAKKAPGAGSGNKLEDMGVNVNGYRKEGHK